MEQREVVWGRERWRWTVGVGAAAAVDATLPWTRHSLAERKGKTRRESGRKQERRSTRDTVPIPALAVEAFNVEQ